MGDIAVRVESLAKRYHIGKRQESKSLGAAVLSAAAAPFRRTARLLRGVRHSASDLEESFWALKDVSFEVTRGEVLGIIGRNGAGKSTLLKILSGITLPTEGHAEIYGRVGSLLEVGTGFHPELTGRENVYLNGTLIGMSRAEIDRNFDEIVAFAEIEKFIDTPVKFYSSGMYVRLAFAVAAHLQPEVLIVDEVLAVGDASFQKKSLGKMSTVASEGRTVLFVSHNMISVKTLCSRAILIEQGRIIAGGDAAKVVSRYLGGDITDRAEKVWDIGLAPGSDSVRCQGVRVRTAAGAVSAMVEIEHPFFIEVDYKVLREGARPGVTLLLYRQDGTLVFSSINNLDTNWHNKPHPRGMFRSVCRIPDNFLNDGRHLVSIILWEDYFALSARIDEAVQFELIDEARNGVRGNYLGGWSGAVRPKLHWETEYLGEAFAALS